MTISDGFGDAGLDLNETEDQILYRFHKWLHYMAYQLTKDDSLHEDLVQEGRIAMWRALRTHDPEKGALPTWVTTAAKARMKDLARGHGQPTGHEARRGVVEAKATTSVDLLMEDGLEAALGISEALDDVEWSYHRGEILEALAALSPSQREYVFLRFWGGLDPASRIPEMRALVDEYPILRKRYLWNGSSKQVGAKDRLREALAHLVAV